MAGTGRVITVYEKPNCTMCTATKRFLGKNKVHYAVADIDDEVRSIAQSRGISAAPIVVVDHGDRTVMWGGYNPEKLREEAL